jgi:prophage regulatory protein
MGLSFKRGLRIEPMIDDANSLSPSPPTRSGDSNSSTFNARRTIRRKELRLIVPLADTTIYELEQRGEFPRRFNLTPRCVGWDLSEVEAWIGDRKRNSTVLPKLTPHPDVRLRKSRPVRLRT